MAYKEKIQKAQQKAHSHSIATKILDMMDKLRMSISATNSRRWVWELLQNAKDVPRDMGKISVIIDFQERNNSLVFSHNGNPFTTENITFLIEQVSTKERVESGNKTKMPTGRFGTGFLTTHLLSEIVKIDGVVKEISEPYKQFSLTLDRSGETVDEIVNSVECSLNELKDIDNSPEMEDYNEEGFNTKFSYKLDNNGVEVAKNGIVDLHHSMIYTLAFLPEIEAVHIVNQDIEYKLLDDYEVLNGDIKIYTVIEKNFSGINKHKIIVLEGNNIKIAMPIEFVKNCIYFKEINNDTPKLFCDFPLIGTEDFPFPAIINSSYFNPTEPRDGVYLTNTNNAKVNENKSLILSALELCYTLLKYASENNFGNMFLMARFNTPTQKDWLFRSWILDELIKPLRNELLNVPIVDTENNSRDSIQEFLGCTSVWFPYHKNKVIRKKMWELALDCTSFTLPRIEDLDNWCDVIWGDCETITIKSLTEFIEGKGDLSQLTNELSESVNVIEWLNKYYILLDEEKEFVEQIITDKYSVIPNQNGIFKKRSELKIDKQIDEELKNVLNILDEDCREYLLKEDVHTGKNIKYYCEEQKNIVKRINEIISDESNWNIDEACYYLISLFSYDALFPQKRHLMYQFCKTIFKDVCLSEYKITNWSEEIWENADMRIVKRLVKIVSDCKNSIVLTEYLQFNDSKATIKWLSSFIDFLAKYDFGHLLNGSDIAILPNQNGDFIIKDDLFLDDGEIDEVLKDISKQLGYDFRKDLLDIDVFLELPKNRVKNEQNIADEISSLLKNRFKEYPRSDETKAIFRKLFLWFNDNKEQAERIFGETYRIRHKLYDDDEIATNMEKNEKIDSLLSKYNVELSNLETILMNQVNNNSSNLDYEELGTVEDFLIQSGIYSQADLDKALTNKLFADNFQHVSDSNPVKFEYVQRLLERCKHNILEFLKNKKEYSYVAEISKTIFLFEKNNETVFILTRPSDCRQIIIYYDFEKDLLDYEKDWELWIEDGKTVPKKISLGRILKITGINKIPLWRIK